MAGRKRSSSREEDAKIVGKAKEENASPARTVRGFKTLCTKIETIRDNVERYLGNKKNEYILITNADDLNDYIQDCIKNGIAAIDTETTSLDPLTCTLVGFSLYTPGRKACYVPINHLDYITNERIENQLTEEQIKPYFQMLQNFVKLIFFNACYDIRVIRHTVGVYLKAYFDCYIAARLLNENEKENGLKYLHSKYCAEEEEFSFSQLFEKVDFRLIPIATAYLYAAKDAQVTFELYEFQLPYLTATTEECKSMALEGIANIFWTIEMPLIDAVADIDDRGVRFDFEYQKELSKEYHEELDATEKKFYEELKKYTVNTYSISSSKQLCELFYDDLKVLKPVWDRKAGKYKRTVDADTIENCNHPLCSIILEYRKCQKLLSTYVDKMAEIARRDGRVHCTFNQMGTDTGRFSCSNPNLQNIPSHNTKIRKMFLASEGYVMIGADFSAQEPRMTAHMCNDERMIKAYKDGKDLYCEIASIAFNVPYEDCLEFNPDGSKNPEGKERRGKAKAIVLGICYGKGVKAIGEDLHVTKDEAQGIYDKVLEEFPRLRQFMDDSISMAYRLGYVTTLMGRKRRLPDINLPKFEFTMRGGRTLTAQAKFRLTQKLSRLWFDDRKKYIDELAQDGIIVKDNGGFIAKAERQCVNARIQGGAGDQIKIAMNKIAYDKELNELGFHILLQIHDELIGECPRENAKQAGKRFQYLMEHAMDGILSVPSKCDIEYTEKWYGEGIEL